jgi:hypothetical protein
MGFIVYFSILFLILFGVLLLLGTLLFSRNENFSRRPFLPLLGLLALALLLVPLPRLREFYQINFSFLLLVVPALLALSTLLILQAFRVKDRLTSSRPQESGPSRSSQSRLGTLSLVTGGLLLLGSSYRLYWFLVWDSTDDSIGSLAFMPLLAAAVACGFWLTLSTPVEFKTARLLFLFALPLLLFGTYYLASQTDFRRLSENRLERVGQAVEAYYARESRYPQNLRQLVPRYLLSLPDPVFIYGQDWCYQAGEDGFQLAYLTRDQLELSLFIGHLLSLWQPSGRPGEPVRAANRNPPAAPALVLLAYV